MSPSSTVKAEVAAERLLDREDELRQLDLAITAACEGAGSFVVFGGASSAGKSSLLAAARRRADVAGMTVLQARGGELEQEFAYGMVRQLFEPLVLKASHDERARLFEESAALAAPLFSLRDAAVAPGSEADVAFRRVHGLFWLTANVAARSPLLLSLDDLDYSDAPSLRWLIYLARRLEGLPVLVVAGARTAGSAQAAEFLAEALHEASIVALSPLGPESVACLVRETLGDDATAEFCTTCHRQTSGNPRLVVELLDALADENLRPSTEHCRRVRQIRPEAVARSLRLRLARLAPEATALARAVAILGDGADVRHAAALAELPPQDAMAAAITLGQVGVLRTETPLAFANPVERGAVYTSMAPVERDDAHLRAARMLSDESGDRERIAAQFLRASPRGDPSVVAILRDSAADALAQGASETAVAHLRRALAEPPTDGARADVLVELGLAERLVDLPQAIDHLSAALELQDDPRSRAGVGLALARTLFFAGHPEQAVEAFESALTTLGDRDAQLRSQLRADLLSVTMLRPALFPIARRQLDRMQPEETRRGDLSGRMLTAMLALHSASGGDTRDGCAERAQAALDGDLLLDSGIAAFDYACRVLVAADRFEAADDACERALAHGRRHGSISAFAIGLSFRGGLALARGELADAEEDARAAVEIARAHGVVTALPFALTNLALVLVEQGEPDVAADMLDSYVEEAPCFGDLPSFSLVRGRMRQFNGDCAGALADMLEAGRRCTATEQDNPALWPWRSEAAQIQLALGLREEARRLSSPELALAREWGAPRTLGRALRVAGLVAGGAPGIALLHESLEVLDASPARLECAKTLIELGGAVRRDGSRREARSLLARGLELADHCGARPLITRGRTELRAAGSRPRRTSLSGVDSLTPSERRVASMAASGMTNRGIAQELFVTRKTVEVHLSNSYRKLEIGSRMQLPRALGL